METKLIKDILLVELNENISGKNAAAAKKTILALFKAKKAKHLIFDFGKIIQTDKITIEKLADIIVKVMQGGGKVRSCRVRAAVLEEMELAMKDDLFQVELTEEECVKGITG